VIHAQRLNAFLLLVGDGEVGRQRQVPQRGQGFDEGIALAELPLAETPEGTLRLLGAGCCGAGCWGAGCCWGEGLSVGLGGSAANASGEMSRIDATRR
jgi:hypothetical protein